MAAMDEQTKMSSEPTVTKEGGGEGKSSPERKKRNLEEEFNAQRAKMKELYLQKEDDLRRMVLEKEQLDSEVLSLRAELQQLQTLSENQKSEIQSLQLLVNETVEASSSGTEEVRRLRAKNLELEQQLAQLKQQQQDLSLVPATFVRSLARKLGADTETDQPLKKNSEDNELLSSIIEPLELEISALKGKLRETDTQLQEALKAQATNVASTVNNSTEKKADSDVRLSCDMCANYERQLVAEQARADAALDRAAHLHHSLKLAGEELEGVRSTQDETVRAWASERAAGSAQLAQLEQQLQQARQQLEQRAAAAHAAERRALRHVTALTVERETLQKRLDSLERDNAMLIGEYLKKAEEMQNEVIDLPDNVEELQELALRLREQLIMCELGREQAGACEQELRGQLLAHAQRLLQLEDSLTDTRGQLRAARYEQLEWEQELRGQLLAHAQRLLQLEDSLTDTRGQLRAASEELERLQTEREQMKELADKLRHSNEMIESLLEDKKRLQNEVMEVRSRVSVLQQELDNSEKVQQDFVRLSQSLQVQLQRIREADSEVRWQHDEDVSECPSCRTALPTVKKKVHCRHCGRIFCGACVSHTVPSGPRGTPARVCSVCSTLLQPHTAPYFSTAPPHSPD